MFLERIVATKREEIARLKTLYREDEWNDRLKTMPPCRGFARALAKSRRSMGLIAEIKKASPSKGLIREDFDPVAIARAYELAGADCLSVLTDEPYFQGSNEYLRQVKEAVRLPVLRKEFILDPIQVYEARLIGADAILLIAAILSKTDMEELMELARSLGMDVLIEVHNEKELETVLSLEPLLVGINNRNLHTFETDLKTTETLIAHIPDHVTVVSESGIAGKDDLRYLQRAGAHAVLIGEHFMRQKDVGQAVKDLMGAFEGNEAG